MAHTQTTPADIPGGSPVRPRGVLASATPAPEGWETGGISTSVACPTPVIDDKCIRIAPAPLTRPTTAVFPAFMIEQGVECSTLSGGDREAEARAALEASTDYALGLTLANGIANDGAPSFADADDLGDFADVLSAVAALECAAIAAGKGQEYVLHASIGAVPSLANAGLIDGSGRAPSGATWIISTGYPCPEGEALPQIWATGRVWAAAGAIDTDVQVDRPQNNREAWAWRSLIVGFNTCINIAAAFMPSVAGGGGVDTVAREAILSLEGTVDEQGSDIADLQLGLDSKLDSVVAGDGIAVDATDPKNPVVSAA